MLDPILRNVAIDAMSLGKPVICLRQRNRNRRGISKPPEYRRMHLTVRKYRRCRPPDPTGCSRRRRFSQRCVDRVLGSWRPGTCRAYARPTSPRACSTLHGGSANAQYIPQARGDAASLQDASGLRRRLPPSTPVWHCHRHASRAITSASCVEFSERHRRAAYGCGFLNAATYARQHQLGRTRRILSPTGCRSGRLDSPWHVRGKRFSTFRSVQEVPVAIHGFIPPSTSTPFISTRLTIL